MTFERAIFDFLETGYDFFPFFLEGKTLRWEKFASIERNVNDIANMMRKKEREGKSVFVYIPWNITVEIIDCFVLLFEGNTRHCLNNKEMKWNK